MNFLFLDPFSSKNFEFKKIVFGEDWNIRLCDYKNHYKISDARNVKRILWFRFLLKEKEKTQTNGW